ncbi:MAG: MlaD family protein [Candidatus Baltobacteraceae bacterium]|jgi:ABC-type transporter Mla subunit MlaD
MTKQAQVGLFTILGVLAVFAVFYVLADFGTRSRGYKIGVHFESASGLRSAAIVYLSGVPVGAVDRIELEPDYTTDVILAIKSGFEIPKDSRFLIQAPLTGEPSVLIQPPRSRPGPLETLPHVVLALEDQPHGNNPTSIGDLLEEGQGEIRRFDKVLAQLQDATPRLLAELQTTLHNTNALTTTANGALRTFAAHSDTLASSLQLAGSNVVDITGTMDATLRRNSAQIDAMVAQWNRTSRSFGQTVDALRDVATAPGVKEDLLQTTHSFAVTAKTFAALTQDLRQVTGNPQTQAQLRDTVARIDAMSQKIDSLAGQLGGKSSVYGVDAGATPAPGGSAPPAALSTAWPALPPADAPILTPPSAAPSAPAGAASPAVATFKQRLNRFTKDLVQLQVRVSELSPQRPGSASGNVSPLLTADRGPLSDFNLAILPNASTGLFAGVNDVGANSTGNFMLVKRAGGLRFGGGIEYSRLGGLASIGWRSFGFEGRLYDLRHPTADAYLNLFAAPNLQLFGGERDLTHTSRRTVFGLQFEL